MSASGGHPLNGGGYDKSLLAATPEVSKAAKQEGYNVDLLDEHRQRAPSTRATQNYEAAPLKETYATMGAVGGAGAMRRKVPFYKTRAGIITIAILAIVIVGAVVGGAVGGTVGHHNNDHPQSGQQQSTTPANNSSQPQVSSGSPVGAADPGAPGSSSSTNQTM
ncbi:hypothetical protein K439DRAFT_1626784 [Ramaria rubella]|nr:hypothetical protein K439DRAFT_1626784 [Ramaria rubella]